MLRTIDGKNMMDIVKELDKMPISDDLRETKLVFRVDGSTSGYIRHDGKFVDVIINDIYCEISGGGNLISIPNYKHSSLPGMLERAIELIFFEYNMTWS